MAQLSGFFESKWDETIINPETGTLGDWDIKYYYNQFSDYFSKFFGNGVYYNPDNCLKVLATGGMSVQVKAGWAFINGYWFQLEDDLVLQVPANSTAYTRTDSVILRWSLSNRAITLVYATDTVEPTRNDTVYDLILAQLTVISGAASIFGDVITDTRTNAELCGIVRGLEADSIDTDTLFAQYDAIFNEWFDGVKDQVTGDLAIKVQMEYEKMQQDIDTYYSNTQTAIADYQAQSETLIEQYQEGLDQTIADYEGQLATQISGYQTQYRQDISDYESQIATQISGYNSNYQQTLSDTQTAAETAQGLVANFVEKDFVIEQALYTFTNKVCTIENASITSDTLVDVYFVEDDIEEAIRSVIYPTTMAGVIILTAKRQPTKSLGATIRVRVR